MANILDDICEDGPVLSPEMARPKGVSKATIQRCISKLSPYCQTPSWTEVAIGYLGLTQWGPPPWTELQWVTLRNVIELAEGS